MCILTQLTLIVRSLVARNSEAQNHVQWEFYNVALFSFFFVCSTGSWAENKILAKIKQSRQRKETAMIPKKKNFFFHIFARGVKKKLRMREIGTRCRQQMKWKICFHSTRFLFCFCACSLYYEILLCMKFKTLTGTKRLNFLLFLVVLLLVYDDVVCDWVCWRWQLWLERDFHFIADFTKKKWNEKIKKNRTQKRKTNDDGKKESQAKWQIKPIKIWDSIWEISCDLIK